MSDEVVMKLSRPIEAHGERLSTLTLRCPTVKELRKTGAPYRLAGAGGGAVDYEACAGLLSAICGVPPSAIDQLEAGDFDEAAWRLVGFMRRSSEEIPGTESTG